MTELNELIKIRQILEAIASKDGHVLERLPEEVKQAIENKNTELKQVESLGK